MGRAPCCDKQAGVKKGPWTPDEDLKLIAYIQQHGHGSWRALPANAGLARCGKSCRLRWTNYLRPDIKRGRFSFEEEQTIFRLHAILGNRWSAIASRLPRRTDNEIKNYWNTHLKKRLNQVWVEPTLLASPPTGLTHVTQWDLTLAEAEARLKRGCRAPVHPSAFFMRSWPKTSATATATATATAPEPTFGAALQQKPQPQQTQSSFNTGSAASVSEALSSCTGTSTVSMADDSHTGSGILFQNQISPPTSSSHGTGGGAGPAVHSPSGSTTSDCLDFILQQHQSSQFPVLLDQMDTFWQRQHAAMVDALNPHGVPAGPAFEHVVGPLDDSIIPLHFDVAEFDSLCQAGPQFPSPVN